MTRVIFFFSLHSPPAGPGFPGYPYPPFSQPKPQENAAAPTAETATATSVNPQYSSHGDGEPAQQTAPAGGGLFQPRPRDTTAREAHTEGTPGDEQTAGTQLPVDETEEQEGERGGVGRNSSTHVDSEIRQRRLERLHSMPTTLQQSLSPLADEKAIVAKRQSPVAEEESDSTSKEA